MTDEERRTRRNELQRARRAANREAYNASARERRALRRDEVNAKERARCAANREAYNARKYAYRAANREKIRKQEAVRRALNIEKMREKWREQSRKFRECNPGKIAEWKKESKKLRVKRLTGSYVAGLIGMPLKSIPHELLEAKREQVLTYRCIKQLQTTLKEKETA